ncbi:ABC transporter permease [Motilimonas cestriensis]|uniref:ABC transporter permease n=1 Tax=Motilimonas cestriensis TaxID=2742685 RepID=A0ABS8W591_9GAMM|nr:FtsX-like permease family protein [Motilimonas cestriensis]MCE2593680.1 ABC transporter permease [Motilimonas cestriensis]
MKNNLLLKWRWRECWQGQLWPITLALSLIIACVFALSALVTRVDKIMVDQGRSALGADLVLVSNQQPISPDTLASAKKLGLTISQQTRIRTMAFSDNGMQLISLKAMETNYPLRGELQLDANPLTANAKTLTMLQHVQPNELWLAERLFNLLDVSIGDTVAIGDAELTVSGKIAEDPELSFNPFNQMPSAIIHLDDIAKTGAVVPGGRLSYRAYFSGPDSALNQLQQEISITASQRWLSEQSQGRSAEFINKAQQYLSLTLLLVLLMASATLVLTSQHYRNSQQSTVAMLKSLGASQAWLRRWLAGQLAMLFGLSIAIGISCGFLLEQLLRLPLTDLLPDPLPSIGFSPWLVSIGIALLVGLPSMGISLLHLLATPATSIIGQDTPTKKQYWAYSLLLLPLISLIVWFGNNKMMWLTLVGLAVILVLLGALGLLITKLLQQKRWGPAVTLALSRLNRSRVASMAQLGALTCSLMLLSVIWLLRSDLLNDWQQTLPANAPNVFAINIAPEQVDAYINQLDQWQLDHSQAYPVIRGRLTQRNDEVLQSVSPAVATKPETEADKEKDSALRRELNFTWLPQLPSHNEVLEGEWSTERGVSVEQDIAERLNIKLGDTLHFSVNSQSFSAKVNSIRKVEWRNMKPNFYFIFSPDVMADLPTTWLVSFRIDDQQTGLLNQLARDYATVSLLDLRSMATRIQSLLQQVAWSLTVLAALAVLSGLLLVLTLLRLSVSQRQQEIKLYRTLGASKKRISATLWAEYGLMALIAGFTAALGAQGIIAAVVKWGFELPVQPHFYLFITLPVLALALIYVITLSMFKQLLAPLRA